MEALKRCTLGAVRLARTSQILSTSISRYSPSASYIVNNSK